MTVLVREGLPAPNAVWSRNMTGGAATTQKLCAGRGSRGVWDA